MLSRIFEERGLCTVGISLVREHTVKIKPPRAVFVPFPFGIPLGHRYDVREQRAVLEAAFATLDAPSGPVLVDFTAPDRNERGAPLQAADVEVSAEARAIDLAGEVDAMVAEWGADAGLGLSRVPPQRFVEFVRFLQDDVAGSESDAFERPPDLARPQFVRYGVDDLRRMYMDVRMRTHPEESSDDRQRWFLGRTALGAFLRELRDHMNASEDPLTKATAAGIAR